MRFICGQIGLLRIVCVILLFHLLVLSNVIDGQSTATAAWRLVKSPIYSDLDNLFIFSDGSGIALGEQLIGLSSNEWFLWKKEFKNQPLLLHALKNNKVWVALLTVYQDSKLLFYDGIEWQQVYNPLANRIIDIDYLTPTFGVISGLGEIAIFESENWKFLEPPSPGIYRDLKITEDSVIWVLNEPEGIYKIETDTWTHIVQTNNCKKLFLINSIPHVIKSDTLFRIISDTIQYHSNDSRLSQINSIDVTDSGNLCAVGNAGLILSYREGEWVKNERPVKENLNSISMVSDSSGWIVGDAGTILQLSNRIQNKSTDYWKGFDEKKVYLNAKIVDDEYGVSAADFNSDGLVDLFVSGLYEKNHLYINKGNNNFKDEADDRGINITQNELNLGCCAGDLDNDGDYDLYVTLLNGKNKILRNIGDGYFVDYSEKSNAEGESFDRTNSVIFGDVDNDGDLDIFITNEYSSNRIFLNNGAGIFSESTSSVGLTSDFGGTGAAFGDIDNDGDIDLYVTNWSSKNLLYKNLLVEKNSLEFIDNTVAANVGGEGFTKSNGVVFSDIDNDADLDLFVTNRKTSNRLYINDGNGIFTDQTENMLGLDSMKSYGVSISDFDSDGFRDIYIANVGDNTFFKNTAGIFNDENTVKYGLQLTGYSTGTALFDSDNDGDNDLYVASYIGEGSTIFVNNLDNLNYVKIDFDCVNENKYGVGTKIFVYKEGSINNQKDLIWYSVINAGESYASMNELTVIIPTLENTAIDLNIVFPSGKQKHLQNVNPGSILTIRDVEGFKRGLALIRNYLHRLIYDTYSRETLTKWIAIIILLSIVFLRGKRRYNWSNSYIIIFGLLLIFLFYIQIELLGYSDFLLSTFIPLTSIVLLLSIISLFSERKYAQALAEKERIRLQEKLSRELHDDLSGTIGSIAIYLEILKKSLNSLNERSEEIINKINKLISDTSTSVSDMIWTIKPTSELLTHLINRVRENYSRLFTARGIEFRIRVNLDEKKITLNHFQKHNIYLIIKEALMNILKHADAGSCELAFEEKEDAIMLSIQDDGKGFNIKEPLSAGNGITNIKNRAEEISAEFRISSNPNSGTKITVRFKIT